MRTYRINTIPAQAAREKGFAQYPEDFPHLIAGRSFATWKSGDDWEIETTLHREALVKKLEELQRTAQKRHSKPNTFQ